MKSDQVATKAKLLKVVDHGTAFRNPSPQVVSKHAFFPSVIVIPDGTWVLGMDMGSAFEATDVRSCVIHSRNQGRTWSEPLSLPVPQQPAASFSMTSRLAAVNAAEIVGVSCYFDRSFEGFGLTNPATEGFVPTQFALIRSLDGGFTWTAPEPIQLPLDWPSFETCSPVVAVAEDRWLLPTSIWPNWQGECPLGMKSVSWISRDRGQTWREFATVHDLWSRRIAAWEQKQVVLSDGRLLSVAWAFDFEARQSLPNIFSLSSDGGSSFGPAHQTPLAGETCTPFALPDNQVLCVYRRTDRPGLWAHLARIEGDHWVALADLNLWNGDSLYGELSDSVMKRLGTLRFGCPTIARIDDSSLLVAFWCVEECVSNIRWFRLGVEL